MRLHDGTALTGRVGDAAQESVALLVDGELREVRYADVAHAGVQVEFKPAPAAEIRMLTGDDGAVDGAAVSERPGTAAIRGGDGMNVDIAALRTIEREKDIPFDTVIEAIETALLTAYRHTDGHQSHARVDIDRKSGAVRVMAQELTADGDVDTEWDDPPEGFGRIAATTARQVIVQRLRDAEHERTYGEFAAKEGEIVAGVVQRDVRANRCRGRPTATASGCAATSWA